MREPSLTGVTAPSIPSKAIEACLLEFLDFCPKCKATAPRLVSKRETSTFTQVLITCSDCKFVEALPPIDKPLIITDEERDSLFTDSSNHKKRIKGISAKESRRIYLRSPAGKEAINRYRKSKLYKEAQARYRSGNKYKDTQLRFKSKVRLFESLLDPSKGLLALLKEEPLTEGEIPIIEIDQLTDEEVDWSLELWYWAWRNSYLSAWHPDKTDREILTELKDSKPGWYQNIMASVERRRKNDKLY